METQKASTRANPLQTALHWELSLVGMMALKMDDLRAGLMAFQKGDYWVAQMAFQKVD